MPSKRSGIGGISLYGSIYVLGGEQNQGTFNNNERYDPETDTWSLELPMPTARHGLGIVSIDDKIFAVEICEPVHEHEIHVGRRGFCTPV